MHTRDSQASARRRPPRTGVPRSARGQSLVEAAIGVVLLLLLTFSVVDAAMLFFAYLTLQNGVTEAARYAVTGQQMSNPQNSTTRLSRNESIIRVVRDATPGLTLADDDIHFYDITADTPGSGKPNHVILITVTHPWQLISPMLWPLVGNRGVINLSVSAAMRNEPYPTPPPA